MKNFFVVVVVTLLASCANIKTSQDDDASLKNELSEQMKVLVQASPEGLVPRSWPDKNGDYRMVNYKDWTSGFPAGSYWLLYEMTGDEYWKQAATENTLKLEGVQYLTHTHDLGFMVFCSYGNAYMLTGEEKYNDVVIQASESLITRFDPKVGCIRSWDFGSWQFPVIIDNMMNLEMLFHASKITDDSKFRDVAVSHADVTLEHHYRNDWSCWHVVSYDTITGEPVQKQTHQGINDDSAWGRGQAWGFYGYVMCYRETGDENYLKAAENIGDYILENLPDDMVSYWDFDDPEIPNTHRDASAAAIMASAYYELSTFSGNGKTYLNAANRIVETLTSEEYRVSDGTNGGFILRHSVGHKPGNSEVDVALNYADYYYLEALKRKNELKK